MKLLLCFLALFALAGCKSMDSDSSENIQLKASRLKEEEMMKASPFWGSSFNK